MSKPDLISSAPARVTEDHLAMIEAHLKKARGKRREEAKAMHETMLEQVDVDEAFERAMEHMHALDHPETDGSSM